MPAASTFFLDATKDTPVAISQRRWIVPFPEDNNAYLFEQDFEQSYVKFRPGIIGSAGPVSGFILVEEGNRDPSYPGMVKWTRTYAEPPFRRTTWESFAWRVPGTSTGEDNPFGVLILQTTSNSGSRTLIRTATPHNLSVGDNVIISYNIKFANQTAETTHQVFRTVLELSGGQAFYVDIISEAVTTWQSLNEISRGRVPITKVVPSKVEIEYFKIGAKDSQFKNPEEIPILRPDVIIDALGQETETYSPTTTPTLASYQEKVAGQTALGAAISKWICAEASSIRLWRGPIYERRTRFVEAI